MNRPHFRRHPRPTDPDPYTRPDYLHELLPCPICDPEATRPTRQTRYDAEWPDVLAAEAPGGDLAAMATFTDWGEYDITPWPGHLVARVVDADAEVDLPMVRAAATAYDLGLPVPLRSDPPLYRQALAGHVGAGVGA